MVLDISCIRRASWLSSDGLAVPAAATASSPWSSGSLADAAPMVAMSWALGSMCEAKTEGVGAVEVEATVLEDDCG